MNTLLAIVYCMCSYSSTFVSATKIETLHGNGLRVVCSDRTFNILESDNGYSIINSDKVLQSVMYKCEKEQQDLCE